MEEKDSSIEVPLFHKSFQLIEARNDTMVYYHIQQDQFLTPTFPLCTHSSFNLLFLHTL